MKNIEFENHINKLYKVKNDYLTNYKKRIFVENNSNLMSLNLFDIEQYNKRREPRILNDFINVLKDIKKDKEYRFFTITLKNIDYSNLSHDEILEKIKEQYKTLKDFQTLIFRKKIGKKNSLSNIDKIVKYEITKNYVLHLHCILFYEDILNMNMIYKRICSYKKYKKFRNIGRFEIVVNNKVFNFFEKYYKLQLKKMDENYNLIDGNFKSGDFNYFKKLTEDNDLIKYVYKYISKDDKLENKIFKLLQIKKLTYSHKFFDGFSQKDLKNLNHYFYKIIKNEEKLKHKLTITENLEEKEEINFKLNLIENKENVSINIINRLKTEKIMIDKKEKIKNFRYLRKFEIDNMFSNIPIFTLKSNKIFKSDFVKYKYEYNFDKYFNNYEYYNKNNIFNLHYKYNFIKDYYYLQYKKEFMFDFDTFSRYILMNKDIEKKKIETYKTKKYEEFNKKKDFKNDFERDLKQNRTKEDLVRMLYKDEIQDKLTNQFNKFVSNLFKMNYENLTIMFKNDGELQEYNTLEHLVDIDF